MCDETFSQSSWNTLKFNTIYTLNITFTLIQLELIKNNIQHYKSWDHRQIFLKGT